jgi:hypothetical protein
MHFCAFPSFFNFLHVGPVVSSSNNNDPSKKTTAQSMPFHNDLDESLQHHQKEVEDECFPHSTNSSRQLIELPNELLIGHIFSYLDLKVHTLAAICNIIIQKNNFLSYRTFVP